MRETIAHEVGQAVPLEIIRGGQRYGTSVTLTERPERPVEPTPVAAAGRSRTRAWASSSATSRRSRPRRWASRRKAIPVVTQVAPGSAADRAGLRVGDVIVEANGTADPTSSQVAELRARPARCSCA